MKRAIKSLVARWIARRIEVRTRRSGVHFAINNELSWLAFGLRIIEPSALDFTRPGPLQKLNPLAIGYHCF